MHQINLDGAVIADIELDKLHREKTRTQGALASRYQRDGLGRLLGSTAYEINSKPNKHHYH